MSVSERPGYDRPGLSEEEASLGEVLRRFALDVLAPVAGDLDREDRSASRHLPALAGLGLTGINVPERFGGVGLSPAGIIVAISAVAEVCAATASMLGAHS